MPGRGHPGRWLSARSRGGKGATRSKGAAPRPSRGPAALPIGARVPVGASVPIGANVPSSADRGPDEAAASSAAAVSAAAPSSRIRSALASGSGAAPTASEGLQWRFSWLGFQSDDDSDKMLSESYRRNGGILAFSRLVAPDSLFLVPDEVLRACGDHLVIGATPRLVEKLDILDEKCEFLTRPFPLSPVRVALLTAKATMVEASALPSGLREVVLVVLAVTHVTWQDRLADGDGLQLEFGMAEDGDAVLRVVSLYMERVAAWKPRVLMGHLGPLAEDFAEAASCDLCEHVCWAAQGPTPPHIPGALAAGLEPAVSEPPSEAVAAPAGSEQAPEAPIKHEDGIWLVGRHARLRGQSAASGTECAEGALIQLPEPRVANLQLETSVSGQVGPPTLFIGRSARSALPPKKRTPAQHEAEGFAVSGSLAAKRAKPVSKARPTIQPGAA